MKKSSNFPYSSETDEFSGDQELWDLLGNSSEEKATPLFSRNVLREVRLSESTKPSFWKAVLRPQFLVPGALAVAALMIWNPLQQTGSSNLAKTSEVIPVEIASSMESTLEAELLVAAAETPDLFSDEEVIAMLF